MQEPIIIIYLIIIKIIIDLKLKLQVKLRQLFKLTKSDYFLSKIIQKFEILHFFQSILILIKNQY